MIELLAAFTTPIEISTWMRTLLFFPLAFTIAVVYKTLRTQHLKDIPLSAAVLWITIIAGMYAVATGLWIVFQIMI